MNAEQKEILARVVEDPAAWWVHVQQYAAEKHAQDVAALTSLTAKRDAGVSVDPRQIQKLADAVKITPETRANEMLRAKVARWGGK